MLVDVLQNKSKREIARDALREIKKKNGGNLLPEDVVDEAAHPDHPLHSSFEWNDTEAGRLYRLTQARTLIRVIRVSYIPDETATQEPKVIKVRKYYSLPSDRKEGGGYREVDEIMSDKSMLEELLETAKADVDAVLRRYAVLTEFGEAVRAAMAPIKVKSRKKGNASASKVG